MENATQHLVLGTQVAPSPFVMMQTNVVVTLQIEGIHRWPAARDIVPEVGFLADPHRHIFHIVAKKPVTHDDRDVEIIMLKRAIIKYIETKYRENGTYRMIDFRSMSCEMIAAELAGEFDLCYCSVLEDNENGAEVHRTQLMTAGMQQQYNVPDLLFEFTGVDKDANKVTCDGSGQ